MLDTNPVYLQTKIMRRRNKKENSISINSPVLWHLDSMQDRSKEFNEYGQSKRNDA